MHEQSGFFRSFEAALELPVALCVCRITNA
jgi:hypothetical protein